jgi:hypothetical protein
MCFIFRGNVSVDGRGVGIERPDGLSKEDDEFDAYRKRMMLAYRFRPNPLVCMGKITVLVCMIDLALTVNNEFMGIMKFSRLH